MQTARTAVQDRSARLAGIHAAAQSATRIAVETDFDFRSPHYIRLFQRAEASAFQHPLWLEAVYRLMASTKGARKLVITGRDAGTGALRLVIPLVRHYSGGLNLIETIDLSVGDMALPVYDPSWIPPGNIRQAIEDSLPDHDLIRIRPVDADALATWMTFFEAEAHAYDFFDCATSLSGPFPQWRSGALGQAFRRPLDETAARRFRSGAGELRRLTDSADIAKAIDTIRRQRAGRLEADPIQEKAMQDFYTTLAVAGAGAGFARTYAVMQNYRASAHIFAITWRGCFHYLLIGYDVARNGRHTPGLLLHDVMVEDWMTLEDSRAFHFTIGDETFKKHAPAEAAQRFVLSKAPGWRGRLARAAFDASDSVERMQRATFVG